MQQVQRVRDGAEERQHRVRQPWQASPRCTPHQRRHHQCQRRQRPAVDNPQARQRRKRNHAGLPVARPRSIRGRLVDEDAERKPRDVLQDRQPVQHPGEIDGEKRGRQVVGQARQQQQSHHPIHAVQLAAHEEQEHAGIEEQFDLQRPVHTVDMRHAKDAVDHEDVAQCLRQRHFLARQAEGACHREGQCHRHPVGRKQPRESRDHEVHAVARAVQRHEDDEAADDEKQVDAVVALRRREAGRALGGIELHEARREVEQHHRQRRNTAQRVDLGQPPRRLSCRFAAHGRRRNASPGHGRAATAPASSGSTPSRRSSPGGPAADRPATA